MQKISDNRSLAESVTARHLGTDTAPAQRGNLVEWIPGYWAWDADINNFVWVSGIWRDVPPGRDWVPGYWNEVPEGYQWVPGFWASEDQENIDYLPYPPETLEQGPSTPAPGPDQFWIPGRWIFMDETANYVWQAGNWSQIQANWIWHPAYYAWTPQGAVFVSGYWDYQFVDRGMIFAPVYFAEPRTLVNYVYAPTTVVNATNISAYTFVNQSYSHYYFGDYYDDRYVSRGIVPWHSYSYKRNHDYNFNCRSYRDPNFAGQTYRWYDYFGKIPDHRPAWNYRNQANRIGRLPAGHAARQIGEVGLPRNLYRARHGKVTQLPQGEGQKFRDAQQRFRDVLTARRAHEARPGAKQPGARRQQMHLPRNDQRLRGVAGGKVVAGPDMRNGNRNRVQPRPGIGGGNHQPRPGIGGGNPQPRPRPGIGGGNHQPQPRPGIGGGNHQPRPGIGGGNHQPRPRPGIGGGNPQPRPGIGGGNHQPRPGIGGGNHQPRPHGGMGGGRKPGHR